MASVTTNTVLMARIYIYGNVPNVREARQDSAWNSRSQLGCPTERPDNLRYNFVIIQREDGTLYEIKGRDMTKNLIQVGNSKALILSKDLIGLLGLESDAVEVSVQDGALVVRKAAKPDVQAAMRATGKKYEKALKELAE